MTHDRAGLFKNGQADVFTLDVRTVYQFFSRHAPAVVGIEEPRDDFARLQRQRVMIRPVLAALDLLIQVLLGDASERESSCEHDVEEHAECPHIHRLAVVFVLTHNFGRHVAWGSAENLEPLMVRDDDREAEVDDFDHSRALFDENIIKF